MLCNLLAVLLNTKFIKTSKAKKKFLSKDNYFLRLYYCILLLFSRQLALTVTRVSLLGANPSANLQARPRLRAEHT
jgi:hypothetical protein